MFLRSLVELLFLLGSEHHKLLAIGFWFANLVDAIRDGDASWLIITPALIRVKSPQDLVESVLLPLSQPPRNEKRKDVDLLVDSAEHYLIELLLFSSENIGYSYNFNNDK